MNNSVLSCEGVSKKFVEGKLDVTVLNNINFIVKPKERIAILGSSGAGKSTLLHLLGGLDKPSEGKVTINGEEITFLSEARKSVLRNRHLGFVYQFHHLLPEFSALENVCMPLLIAGKSRYQAKLEASDLLAKMGLEKRLLHKPAELSGGEKQRVAIARALITKPKCVLADEPTGNLDTKTAEQVYELMLSLYDDIDTSLVMVTHDQQFAKRMQRCYVLREGNLDLV